MGRLGVYGGTFDPPHLGHLILAETAVSSLGLDRVLFVPAGQPPHKRPDSIRAPAHHRLAMIERAVAGNPRFAVSRADLDRPGPHYTADLLRLLHDQYPADDLIFLIGSDSLRDLPTWSRPAEIIALAQLGVMRRPTVLESENFPPPSSWGRGQGWGKNLASQMTSDIDLAALEAAIPGLAARILWIDAPLIDLSASTLAARITAGLSVRYQVPDAVLAYIDKHGLYRE